MADQPIKAYDPLEAVFYFVSAELAKKSELNILFKKLYEKAKGFEIPEFKEYAIADGIYKMLFAFQTGIFPQLVHKQRKRQSLFPFMVDVS